MSEESYRRRRWTYSFRAWIDDYYGQNDDRGHERHCICHSPRTHTYYEGVHRCNHLRLWDLNTMRRCRNLIRVVRRRRPFYLRVVVGPRYRTVLRIGRKPL